MFGPGQGQVCTELFRILQVNEGRPWQSVHTFRGSMRSSEGECHHRREGRPRGREVVQTKLTPILYALVCSGKQGPAFPGFPGGLDGKKICLQCRRPGFNACVRKIPWRRERQPTPVFLTGKSHRQRSLAGYSP